jgi:two-component system, chemotaxis family, CheB/CheR fusion protein
VLAQAFGRRCEGSNLEKFRIEGAELSGDEIIVRELSHRLKNVLTMVQVVARQSLKYSPGLTEFGQAFEARLTALGRAHSLLIQNCWTGASMRTLLADQLGAVEEHRIVLNGTDVSLDPNAAYIVALLVHELAVNAQKHGSLSRSTGGVLLTWSFDHTGQALDLEWIERGGPVVQPPQSTGFGTELIRALAGSRLGNAALRYESSGVVCKLRIPLQRSSGKNVHEVDSTAQECTKAALGTDCTAISASSSAA